MATMSSDHIDHRLGTPLSTRQSVRALLLGSGELGREIAIALMRLGVWVCAADSYQGAPAAQVAHESDVLDMADPAALDALIERVRPNIIIPEVEAIATSELEHASQRGIQVVPSSGIAAICMNRELLRVLASNASTVGYPCVVKPIMSSSGHGQSIVRNESGIDAAWHEAQVGRRAAGAGGVSRVIVEALAPLDYELTVLTVSSSAGVATCPPIGQRQDHGDYRESWQPAAGDCQVLETARDLARNAVRGLVEQARTNGELGWGVFGVELFVLTDGTVLFNEVSPRPHDTGMVTMISQRIDEFTLHARAILGLPITQEHLNLTMAPGQVAASHAVVVEGEGEVTFAALPQALAHVNTDLRIFDKPSVHGHRRMAVALAVGDGVEDARSRAAKVVEDLAVDVQPL